MKTDALARRLRFAPPNQTVERIILQDADFLLFEAINRHGPLPTNYLYELTRHKRRNLANLKHRLTEFYNGDAKGSYLVRPPQQFAGYEARYQHLVYDLAPRARKVLAERGMLSLYPPMGSASFLHQLMQACTGASLELTAKAHGLTYRGRAEVLASPRCGNAQTEKKPLSIPLPSGADQKHLSLDDLASLVNAEGKDRFMFIEIDRATESMIGVEEYMKGVTYFGKKLDSYIHLFNSGNVRGWFGFSQPIVLIITTNMTRTAQILRHVATLEARHQARFYVKCETSFGANWRVPKTVLTHLLNEPWETTSGQKHITK